MGDMRVGALAKELGITSAELLAELKKIGIPAQSHATMLTEDKVKQVCANIDPEIRRRSGLLDDKEAEKYDAAKAEEERKQKEEEAKRRAVVEAELAAREAERARRYGEARPLAASGNVAGDTADKPHAAEVPSVQHTAEPVAGRSASAAPAQQKAPANAKPKAPVSHEENSGAYNGLTRQIESEQKRAADERAQRERERKAKALAEQVAKTQDIEANLRNRRGGKPASIAQAGAQGTDADAQNKRNTSDSPKKTLPSVTAGTSGKFNNLLSQIESENKRMETQRHNDSSTRNGNGTRNGQQGKPMAGRGGQNGFAGRGNGTEGASGQGAQKQFGGRNANAGAGANTNQQGGRRQDQRGDKRGKGKRDSHFFEPDVPELSEPKQQDVYATMAFQVEKLQRDKVLAEARQAAVYTADNEGGEGRRKRRKEKREAEAKERAEALAIEHGLDPKLVLDSSVVQVPQGATVAKFAELLKVAPNDVIKRLFMLGQILTLTQSMSDDLIELIADDMGRKVRVVSPEEEFAVVYHDTEADLVSRPPVVTVMGHVDHGKTSLLDAIRNTGVALGEAGGITQHIGASVAEINGRRITFIDTPGHEAFTAMRARGAQVTDVIVLVVAADDGVMPQTVEAINHAKAAKVPIVVAVNKIDKSGANPDKVRQELLEYGVVSEEWGGQNMFVEVSAKKKLHIDDLLETIILQADVLELKANPNALASGFVIEANLDRGRGPVATVLVQRGTLHPGDTVVAGTSYGRVRALIDPHGGHVDSASPSEPVEILGLSSVPTAGDEFRVFEDERDARKLAEERALRQRLAEQQTASHMSLDDLFNRIEAGKQTDLNLIVKADVQGSIEALRDAFTKMDQSEVRINIVHSAVGGITETDVTLAAASDAIIMGFNVRPTGKSKAQAEKEKVDIRLYRVIYQAIEDINAARVGLLKPEIVEEDTGVAEVRETFKVPKVGVIAGCHIIEGEIARDNKVRIVRDGTVVFEGSMGSLRHLKEDVKSVKQGFDCGIGINGFQDFKIGDRIEGYVIKEKDRTE